MEFIKQKIRLTISFEVFFMEFWETETLKLKDCHGVTQIWKRLISEIH